MLDNFTSYSKQVSSFKQKWCNENDLIIDLLKNKEANNMMSNANIQLINRLKAIANMGLLYATNEYDKERYLELESISLQLLEQASGIHLGMLKEYFSPVKDYPTAKVDIRALILSTDKKILLVQEQADGKWSLPGGWGRSRRGAVRDDQ